jgi:hypothetical protein
MKGREGIEREERKGGVSEEDWNARRTEARAEQRAKLEPSRNRITQEVPGGLGGTGVEWVYPLAGWLAKEKKKKRVPDVPGPCSTKWTG